MWTGVCGQYANWWQQLLEIIAGINMECGLCNGFWTKKKAHYHYLPSAQQRVWKQMFLHRENPLRKVKTVMLRAFVKTNCTCIIPKQIFNLVLSPVFEVASAYYEDNSMYSLFSTPFHNTQSISIQQVAVCKAEEQREQRKWWLC